MHKVIFYIPVAVEDDVGRVDGDGLGVALDGQSHSTSTHMGVTSVLKLLRLLLLFSRQRSSRLIVVYGYSREKLLEVGDRVDGTLVQLIYGLDTLQSNYINRK